MHEGIRLQHFNPPAACPDNALPAQARETPGQIDKADAEDLGQGILGDVPEPALSAVLTDEQEIQEIAQFDKGAVVFLVGGFIEQQVGVRRKPVDNLHLQAGIFTEHGGKLPGGKFQGLHRRQGNRQQRLLDFIAFLVVSGENGSSAVERNDLSASAFVFQQVLRDTGADVMDSAKGLPRRPEVFSLAERPDNMGLFLKIRGKSREII